MVRLQLFLTKRLHILIWKSERDNLKVILRNKKKHLHISEAKVEEIFVLQNLSLRAVYSGNLQPQSLQICNHI